MNKWIVIVVIAGLLGSSTLFTVDEREHVILFKFGRILNADFEPGLHFKLPIVNRVRKFDDRILTLDNRAEEFLTVEKKNVIVDFFVKWQIVDVGRYYRATGGSESVALDRLTKIIKEGIKSEFAKRTVKEVVSAERSQIMGIMTQQADESANEFGIKILDVRVKRIDLPEQVSSSVYDRMRQERERIAKQLRSEGAEQAERIQAEADRQRTVLLAEAYAEAEELRGEGDARAADIYAQAFQRDADFYAFYRSLESYKRSIGLQGDVLVLDTEDEYFQYLRSREGG